MIFKKSSRAKRLRIVVHPNGSVQIIVPYSMSLTSAHAFVNTKTKWIEGKVNFFFKHCKGRMRSMLPKRISTNERRKSYEDQKDKSRDVIVKRVAELNVLYGFVYGKISIRNQKTRWGSCSGKGNLNFNYRIATLPSDMSDYIIVHELCHLGEFNHSANFWLLISKTIPNYLELRAQLKKKGMEI